MLRAMSSSSRRRYALRQPELNKAVEALIEQAAPGESPAEDRELARQLVVTAVRLLRDGTSRAEIKLVNSALKELRHAFRVFAPYSELRKVAVFGSARTQAGHPEYLQARAFAERIVRNGWMVITGAGSGIMSAAQGGAGREASFGVNIRLPFEQKANEIIAGDDKLINFRYFFTRKVVFVKEAHAIVLFPGGFGTHDEGFEALTLIQTGKSEIVPVVFIDAPGGHYWRDWLDYVRSHLGNRGLINPEDLGLFRVTDSVERAIQEILGFYRNYHSSRYVGDKLVIRVRHAPDAPLLEELNDEFGDIITAGRIEASSPLSAEEGEAGELPRVVLQFNRRNVARVRALIDRLNGAVLEPPPSSDASRREIIATPLTPEEERAEEDDEREL
jgi:uncharacterized protein (TIGR00730 family)